MNTLEEIIPDLELLKAFEGTRFGTTGLNAYRDFIKLGLLKYASCWSTGHTLRCVLSELKLISVRKKDVVLTRKGKEYLWIAFDGQNNSF